MKTKYIFNEYNHKEKVTIYIHKNDGKTDKKFELRGLFNSEQDVNLDEMKCTLDVFRMNSNEDVELITSARKLKGTKKITGVSNALALALHSCKKDSLKNMRIGYFISVYDKRKKKFVPFLAYVYDKYAYTYKSDLFFIKDLSHIKVSDYYHLTSIRYENILSKDLQVSNIFEIFVLESLMEIIQKENMLVAKKKEEIEKEKANKVKENGIKYRNLKSKYGSKFNFELIEKSIFKIAKEFEIKTDIYNPQTLVAVLSKLGEMANILYEKYGHLPVFPLSKLVISDSPKDFNTLAKYHSGAYDVSEKSISINLVKNVPLDYIVSTFIHEFGHFLDYSYIRNYKTEYNNFLKSVRREQFVKSLRKIREIYKNKKNTYMVNHITYRLKGEELFADFFNYYILNEMKSTKLDLNKVSLYGAEISVEPSVEAIGKFLNNFEKK